MSERKEIAEMMRRRAAKEAPNAKAALKFMADVIEHNKTMPESILEPVASETALVKELRYLPELVLGTRDGELVPLADFSRERVAKALTDAASELTHKSRSNARLAERYVEAERARQAIVELDHDQAYLLMQAREAERDRVRVLTQRPPSPALAGQARAKRIRHTEAAMALGVPLRQIQRFIWGDKIVPKGEE